MRVHLTTSGSERLVARVRMFFNRHRANSAVLEQPAVPAAGPVAGRSYELLALAAPDLARIDDMLRTLHAMIANYELSVLATAVLRKAGDGQVSGVAGDNLPAEGDLRGLTGLPRAITPEEIAAVTGDIAPASYVLAIVLEQQAADVLVQNLARRAPILVSRCTVAIEPTTVSGPVVVPSA